MAISQDDYVKLVNTSDKPISFVYDGTAHTVIKNVRIRRGIAEHAMKKTYVFEKQGSPLKIEELPEAQRNPTDAFEMKDESEELKKLKAEIEELKKSSGVMNADAASQYLKDKNKELKDMVRKLEDENANLKFEMKELKKK